MAEVDISHLIARSRLAELTELNLKLKSMSSSRAEAKNRQLLAEDKSLKAVSVCFSDIEGRLHMLDFDKEFFLNSLDNLTFDGSSIHGLSKQHESDLRLSVDWTSLMYVPDAVFGRGKVVIFADILNQDGSPYESDFRVQLRRYAEELRQKQGLTALMAPEIEGFLLEGVDAEQNYDSREGFQLVSSGGYFHSLPLDKLRQFIDATADAQRAMGFENEKDHPEVAPSQFEINFACTDVVRACDQAQLYKLVCRQIAMNLGLTATFLPKPVVGVNGSGMHVNFSLAQNGKNIFYDKAGKSGLSKTGWNIIDKLLNRASDISLILNSSVNSYRRLDPAYEAPNQIKASASDRGSMLRIPLANQKTARVELRSVAPDANPYLVMLAILKTGLEDKAPKASGRERLKYLPANFHDALRIFKASDYTEKLLGAEAKQKYVERKQLVAGRSPRELGSRIKAGEVIYHHEITNQYLWNSF